MKKVLHVITRLDRGGSAINTLATCTGLAGKYNTLLVCGLSLESNMTDEEERSLKKDMDQAVSRGVRVMTLPSLVRPIRPWQDIRALVFLIRLMVREKPDIVHTHTSKAGLLGRLAAFCARVPVVIHTPHGHIFFGHFNWLASRLFIMLERFLGLFTHRLVALTQGEKNDYLDLRVAAPESLVTIHSGVDVARFGQGAEKREKARKSLGIDPGAKVVGTVGWLLPIKGPGHLLKAMGRVWETHPEAMLVFVGQGPLQAELSRQADQVGQQDKVLFPGWTSHVEDILPGFDVFCLPSLNEGMGRVIVEAMAAGLPVVASEVGGIPDLVEDGRTGFLCGPGDLAGISEAIARLFDDPEKAREMGEQGRIKSACFSLDAMLSKLDALYEEVMP